MSEETVYVDCPCCGAKLEVRRETGRVVGHWAKSLKSQVKPGEDPIKAAQERLKAEKERLSKYLSNAKEIVEQQKRQALEKFEKEKKRIAREGDTEPPPHPFAND